MRRTIALALIVTLGIGAGMLGWLGRPQAQDAGEGPNGLRPGASATLLSDGRWLVGGGNNGSDVVKSAALVDPDSGETTALVPGLRRARAWHAGVVLPDGTVLVSGGTAGTGRLVRRAERFDPDTQTFALSAAPLTPRAHHTASVLTDGRVLLVGGTDAGGRTLATAELWDPRGGRLQAVAPLATARADHTATLLADGHVLVWGGHDAAGTPLESGEVFDPATRHFAPVNAPPAAAGDPAQVATTIPTDGAEDVAPDALLAVRFSAPVTVTSVTTGTVKLTGGRGAVAVRVVAAESGRLLFVTPEDALDPATTYTLTLAGIADATGALPPVEVRFTTRAMPVAAAASGGPVATGGATGAPDGSASDDMTGDNLSAADGGHGHPPWETLPPLEAPPGVTALTGQVLDVNGKPIPGVLLQIDDQVAESGQTGRFLLTGMTCGHCVLIIDGRPASRPRRTYGVFEFGQDIEPGKTNMVMGTIWMPRIDTAHAVEIPSPTPDEIVITTPRIPGLELHLPPNAVIRDKDGNLVHSVSITPFSKTRPIMMPPGGFEFPVFFTIQPGGAHVETPDGTGAWLVYPNPTHLRPRRRVPFFSYDPRDKDWFIYGLGRVSPDGSQIAPEPGTTFTEFHCTPMCDPDSDCTPPPSACTDDDSNEQCSPTNGDGSAATTPSDGDPVDPSTGVFIHKRTDLRIDDAIPIAVTRRFESQDPEVRRFGTGMTHGYAMHLFPPQQFTEMDLVMPDESVVHYVRTSAGDGFKDAVFEHTDNPTKPFFKSKITWNTNGQEWDLTLHDGSVYVFGKNYGLQAIRNRFGAQVTIVRESGTFGKIVRVTSPSGRFIDFTYNAQNHISQITDNTGRTVTYTYSGTYLQTVTDPDGKTTKYSWGQNTQGGRARLVKITNKRGIQYLQNTYDGTTGRIVGQVQADNGTYGFAYTVANRTVTATVVTDPRGVNRRLTYNAKGYLLTDTRAYQAPEQQTVTFARDPSSHLVQTATDGLGRVTKFVYDANGNPTAITRMFGTAEAATTNFTYDPFNVVHTITDPLGHTTTTNHDALGRPLVTIDALGHQTAYSYTGPFGQLSQVTDPLGNATRYSYNLGDLVAVQDPAGGKVQYSYDALGRRVATIDPLGNTTRVTYDLLDHVLTRTDPLGGVTTFTYDENSNLLSSTDPRGHTTTFSYGNMDRLTKRTDPLNRYDQFTYDTDGNVTVFRDGGAVKTAFTYDNLNRPTHVAYNQDSPESTVDFAYDAVGRLTQATDSAFGTITRTYDDFNRLTAEQSCPAAELCRWITYTFDAAGRRTSMTPSFEAAITYSYDNANHLTQVAQNGSPVTIDYDAAGRRAQVELPNGSAMTYGYDAASRLTSIVYSASAGAKFLGDLLYEYDAAGHRVNVDGTWARTGFPVTSVTTTAYDAADELTSSNGTAIPHDAQGDLTGDGPNTYYWNARRQLTEISNGTHVMKFYYDPFGRRWKKDDHYHYAGSVATEYLYDGLTPVQELDGSGGAAITARLLTGPGIDEIFRRTDDSGPRYFLTDALGSTVALTDDSGTVTTEYTYDPFGQTTVTNDVGTATNPYQYAGRENDGTGLYYNRARYYHPGFGRFISADPLELVAKLPAVGNLYAYADDAPTTFIDPLGLDPQPPNEGGLLATALEGGETPPPSLDEIVGFLAAIGLPVAGDILLAEEGVSALVEEGKSFFDGAQYTEKVLEQMLGGPGEYHSFPEAVAAFEDSGTVTTVTGGDGITRELLEIPGEYSGREGGFQFMKDADGWINHRYFQPNN